MTATVEQGLATPPALVERYEQLRAIALGTTAVAHGHGLALLRQRGMTPWMRAWASDTHAEPATDASRPSAGLSATPPPAVVALLTQMAISAATETTHDTPPQRPGARRAPPTARLSLRPTVDLAPGPREYRKHAAPV